MKVNFSIEQGADWVLNFTCKNADGTAKNLTGATLLMTLKTDKYLLDTDASVIKITPTLDATPTDGLFVATCPHGTTINLSGTYYYDLKVIDAASVASYPIKGVVTFTSIVTQRVS